MKNLFALPLILRALPAFAQPTPVGLWKTVDDATGQPKGLVRIVANEGVLTGRIEGSLDPNQPPNRVCDLCTDDRKANPLRGLAVMRGMRASTGEAGIWDGGDILDPDNGKVYRVRLRPQKNGKELEVRGYIGIALFGRTRIWTRAE